MTIPTHHAVLTGDLVDSTKLDEEQLERYLLTLKQSFGEVGSSVEKSSFDIFRGDSFQGLIGNPAHALSAGILIRSYLRMSQPENSDVIWDARTAVGIGAIDSWPERVPEGNGEAFRKSGALLDRMKTDERQLIATPWQEINEEMNVAFGLLDAVINKWSPQQAEVVFLLMKGHSRKQIGKELGISQAAISYRVRGAGWTAVEKLLKRYMKMMKKKMAEQNQSA